MSSQFRCPQFARGSVAEAMHGHVPAAELELAVADDAVNVARLCRAMAEADDFRIRLADIVDRADGCWAWRPRSTARHAARAAMVRRLREDGVVGPAAEDTPAPGVVGPTAEDTTDDGAVGGRRRGHSRRDDEAAAVACPDLPALADYGRPEQVDIPLRLFAHALNHATTDPRVADSTTGSGRSRFPQRPPAAD